MEDILLNYIIKKGNVSFVEIEELFEDHSFNYKGEYALMYRKCKGIIIWNGWNNEAIDLISNLMQHKEIELDPCSIMIYLIDGQALKYPLVKSFRSYKEDHWIPMVINKRIK